MKSFGLLSGLASLSLLSVVHAQLDPIVVKGSKFFYKTNGTQFFIRGVAYQQQAEANGTSGSSDSGSGTATYTDPLADGARCQVDIPLMKQLETNVIRVYAVDPTKDHSVCMNLLQENGIYIFADLSDPGDSINRNTPAWNDALFARYTSVVDMFSNYTNVIGFFAGNEVSNSLNTTAASAFVRAAVRDTKAYIAAQGYRQTYVGYATSDDSDIRQNMANYFNCGDQSSAIDFWGYNIYSWCGNSSYTTSGYDQRVAEFSTYSVPSFFAEYGCNTVQPRTFTEVQALFSSDMTAVFSGGIVYMWFEEANNYGLVDITKGTATQPSLLPDYTYLSSEMALAAPTGVVMSSYNPSNSPQACPAISSGVWEAVASPLPPTPNRSLCECMFNSLSCVVKSTVATTAYGQLFGTVCGLGGGSACAGINTNTDTGVYGAYSMCNATEQLSFALDQYYKGQNSASTACNFGGAATIKQAVSAPASCSAALSQAGAAGTGTVSSKPTGSGSSSAAGKKGAAASVEVPFMVRLMVVGYVSLAAMVGASMILL